MHLIKQEFAFMELLLCTCSRTEKELLNLIPEASPGLISCCCCEVASVVSDSVRPHRWQPTRLHRPRDSPGKNTGVGCHFLLQCMKVKSESEVAQSCPTLSDPMDHSPPGSSVHGIFQARVLEWGAIAFSGAHLLHPYYLGIELKILISSPVQVDLVPEGKKELRSMLLQSFSQHLLS